ncbi:MAG TPA: PKD domain-containing protein [Verrucomicrobiae bacterium]|nr:PKD domain-containing protein [Verrucomicrobiae bacterium]
MKRLWLVVLTVVLGAGAFSGHAVDNQLLGWNNLGMHCMDSDYSVFSILPPYNTIEAQLIVGGRLFTNGVGYSVTYQAVADPDGSFNSTSVGKGNYHDFYQQLYTANPLPADMGLAGWGMPGTNNTPQAMLFEPTNQPAPVSAPAVLTPVNWFRAEGIPLTPYDDVGNKNPYPLMRLIARSGGTPVATNDIVLPVSDEMDCRACHASGTQTAAQPAAGWVWAANPERDYRLNILRLHDERNFAQHHDLYVAALADRGYNPLGLYRGVVADGQPVLCANCHSSEALGTPSFGTIPQLTTSIHALHATVMDPELNLTLDNSANRAACYRCHPGSTTKCLRGAMGGAIAADGSMEMQCQSCHGNMSQVGSSARVGWFMEPNCQGCHTGTATTNSGQIRFTSVFSDTSTWTVRTNAQSTFATQPDIPAAGLSLYRFSAGHGGLQCSACHGSTHAEFPATHRNDNLRNERLQGHAGMMVECTACHTSMSVNSTTAHNGPHGLHPLGAGWVSGHHDYINGNYAQCQACHGLDYRGTVLSRAQATRTLVANFDGGISITNELFRGAEVGCYNCHNGPFSDNPNVVAAPTAGNFATNTLSGQPVMITLPVTGAGATTRIVGQPAHGAAGLSGTIATYFPDPGFVGTDTFTFAAWNGAQNSLLATGSIAVAQGPFTLSSVAHVPSAWSAGWPAPFGVMATPDNVNGTPSYDWDFGDGSVHDARQYATHSYATPGSYNWRIIATVVAGPGRASVTNSGSITVQLPAALALASAPGAGLTLTWPMPAGDALLEETPTLSPPVWTAVTNPVSSLGGAISVTVPGDGPARFYRLRQL